MGQIAIEMVSNEAQVIASLRKQIAAQEKAIDKWRQMVRQSQAASRGVLGVGQATDRTRRSAAGLAGLFGEAFDARRLSGMIAKLIGGGGVLGAVRLVTAAYERQLAVMREIAAESRKSTGDIISFAALQPEGQRKQRVARVQQLAVQFGIADRAQAFDTVQALQSSLGDFEQGLKAARAVFAAAQVGVPVEVGKEVEALGIGMGMQPGEAVRKAFVAGQLSSRDPAVLANAGAALQFFQDKTFGFASAAALAGQFRPDELRTFVSRLGEALGDTSPVVEKFREAGATTQLERLRFLARLGIDTPAEAKQFGFTEKRQQQAIAAAVGQVENIVRFTGQIEQQAVPGVFDALMRSLEREIPTVRLAREGEQIEAALAAEQAFGGRSVDAQRQLNDEQLTALALRRLKADTGVFSDFVEEGRTSKLDLMQLAFERLLGLGGTRVETDPQTGQARVVSALPSQAEIEAEKGRIREEIREGRFDFGALRDVIAQGVEQGTREAVRRPTLVPPNMDR